MEHILVSFKEISEHSRFVLHVFLVDLFCVFSRINCDTDLLVEMICVDYF